MKDPDRSNVGENVRRIRAIAVVVGLVLVIVTLGAVGLAVSRLGSLRLPGLGEAQMDSVAAARETTWTGRMREEGYVPLAPPRASFLEPLETEEVALELPGGKCYRVAGYGGAGFTDLDLWVMDSGGREVARDILADAFPIAGFCARETDEYTVRFRSWVGSGSYGSVAYVKASRPSSPPSGAE